MKTHAIAAALLLGGGLLAAQAQAAGNAAKGADTFAEECGDCHSVSAGKNKKGPSLNAINGRPAGSVADFAGYSEAIRQAGFAWTPERIDAYIAQPRKIVPAGRMKYDGLADAAARADIVAYLLSIR